MEPHFSTHAESRPPACGLCGRMLGIAFHFTCHVCGATYCYVHMPEKCDHIQVGNAFFPPVKEPADRPSSEWNGSLWDYRKKRRISPITA